MPDRREDQSRIVGALQWLCGIELPTLEELLWGSSEPEVIWGPGVESDLEFSQEELDMLEANGYEPPRLED